MARPLKLGRTPRRRIPGLIALGRLVASALGLISTTVIARSLGPDGRGTTSAVLAICFMLGIVFSFGLPLVVRRAAAVGDAKGTVRASRDIALFLTPLCLAIGVGSTMLLQDGLVGSDGVLVVVAITAAPLLGVWTVDQSFLIAQSRYVAVSLLQVVGPSTVVVVLVLLAEFDEVSVGTVVACHAAGLVASALMSRTLTRVAYRGQRESRLAVMAQGRRFFGATVGEAASNRLDQVLMLPILGATGAGYYSIAVTVAAVPLTLGHALGAAAFNTIAKSRRRTHVTGLLRKSFAVALTTSLAIAAASPSLVPLAFGPEFSPAIRPTMLACLGVVFAIPAYVATMCLAAEGRGTTMSCLQWGSVATGVGLLLWLGPSWGARGAALASTCTYALLCVSSVIALGCKLRDVVPRLRDFNGSVRLLTNADPID